MLVGRCGNGNGSHVDRRRQRGESGVQFGGAGRSAEITACSAGSEPRSLLHQRRQGYRYAGQHHGVLHVSTDRAAGGCALHSRLRPYSRYVAEFYGRPNPTGAAQLSGGATVQLPRSTASLVSSGVRKLLAWKLAVCSIRKNMIQRVTVCLML